MTNISHKWSCLKVTSIRSTSLNSFHGEIRVFLNHVKITQCYRHGYNNVNGFIASSWQSHVFTRHIIGRVIIWPWWLLSLNQNFEWKWRIDFAILLSFQRVKRVKQWNTWMRHHASLCRWMPQLTECVTWIIQSRMVSGTCHLHRIRPTGP